jgi:hypothetical protein
VATVLVSHHFNSHYGAELTAAAAREGTATDLLVLPPDPAARLPDAECARIEAAFFSEDIFPDYSRQFFSAVRKAPRLDWLHVFGGACGSTRRSAQSC